MLVVDDELHLRLSLAEILRRRGYQVEEAGSGDEALNLVQSAPFDLMLLDMVMPGMSGVEVMRRARQLQPELLIIVLTAHASVENAIAAVKADVADYMLKPCNIDDLVVTVSRTLQEQARQMRRQRLLNMVSEAMDVLRETPASAGPGVGPPPSPTPSGQMMRVGPLTLDRHRRLAIVEGDSKHTAELTEGEASVLVTLMQHPNQVLSCTQLAETALGYEGMDRWTVEGVIRSCVFRLRQKIEAAPDTPRLICTVRGRGYFFSHT